MTRFYATTCAVVAAIFFALGFWGGYERGYYAGSPVHVWCLGGEAMHLKCTAHWKDGSSGNLDVRSGK